MVAWKREVFGCRDGFGGYHEVIGSFESGIGMSGSSTCFIKQQKHGCGLLEMSILISIIEIGI